jgi:hypothetical protein
MITFKDYKPEPKVPDCLQYGIEGVQNAIKIYKGFDCFSLTERRNILDRAESILKEIPIRSINEVGFSNLYRNLVENYEPEEILERLEETYQLSFLETKPETRIKRLAEKTIATRFCKSHQSDLQNIKELYNLLSKAEQIIEQRSSPSTGTLNIFDIDDTLFRTNDKIKVLVKGKVVKELDSEAFAHYHLSPGEKFDFSEFRDGHKFLRTAQPIKRMMSFATRLVKFSGPKSRTIIVTARSDFDNKNPFLQRFRDAGFPIDQVYVYRAGNDKHANNTGEAKKKIIDRLLASGKYDTVRMWDDSSHNLDAFLYLKRSHKEVKFEAYRVEPSSGLTTAVH